VKPIAKAVLAALMLLASCREATPAQAPDKPKPTLYLLTALPLVWSESFGLDQPGSPALQALEQDYEVKPIDLPSQVPAGALLLAAQPRALPAEELVALDAWVRRGGRLLLLADPLLEWPSELPLGDLRRPPVSFADTGLLQHWGLRLDAPERRGVVEHANDAGAVTYVSPGELIKVGGNCDIEDRWSALCQIDRGRVFVVADADFLDEKRVEQIAGHHAANLGMLRIMLMAVRGSKP
jgi:hypothetical protein